MLSSCSLQIADRGANIRAEMHVCEADKSFYDDHDRFPTAEELAERGETRLKAEVKAQHEGDCDNNKCRHPLVRCSLSRSFVQSVEEKHHFLDSTNTDLSSRLAPRLQSNHARYFLDPSTVHSSVEFRPTSAKWVLVCARCRRRWGRHGGRMWEGPVWQEPPQTPRPRRLRGGKKLG
jgi:hypothetical protein